MLRDRVLSGFVLALIILAAAIWLPSFGILLFLLTVATLGQLEFYTLLDTAKMPAFKWLGTVGGFLLILLTGLHFRVAPVPADGCDWDFTILFVLTISILLRTFPQKNNPTPLVTIAATLMGIMYVPFLFNAFTKILMAWDHYQGIRLALYLLIVVKLTDTGAYFTGLAFGQHKLIPRISPAKTWEGFFGGLVVAALASWLFCVIANGNIGPIRISQGTALWLGLLLGLCGTVGDLTESLLKRAAGVKDSSKIIFGMGGILDVIDSLLFAAPALYIFVRNYPM